MVRKGKKVLASEFFFDDTQEGISKFFNLDLIIKTTEVMAIFLAMKMALDMGKVNIVIYTDSSSSCVTLKKSIHTFNPEVVFEN